MRKFREMIFSGGNKGFTLIELLVVIAVLGILAGIAVPRLTGVSDRARKTEAISALGSLKTALEIEQLEATDGAYPSDIAAVADEYLDGSSSGVWDDWTITWNDDGNVGSGYINAPSDGNFTVKMDNSDGLLVYLEHTSGSGYTIID
jgi:prepilin-type N-terminal cleavage/methylation domain-containing protein